MFEKHKKEAFSAYKKAWNVLCKHGLIKEFTDEARALEKFYQENKKLTRKLEEKWGDYGEFTIFGDYYKALVVIAYAKAIDEGREKPTEDDVNWAHRFIMGTVVKEIPKIFLEGEELEAYYILFVRKHILGGTIPDVILFITNKRVLYWNRNIFAKLSSPFAPSKVSIPLNEDERVTRVCGIYKPSAGPTAKFMAILTNKRLIGVEIYENEFGYDQVSLRGGEEIITQLTRYPNFLFLTTEKLVFFHPEYSITGPKIKTAVFDRGDKSVKAEIQEKRGFLGGLRLVIRKEKPIIEIRLTTDEELNAGKEIERIFHL